MATPTLNYIPASERMKPAFRLRHLRRRYLAARESYERCVVAGNEKWTDYFLNEMQRIEREGKRLKSKLELKEAA